MGGMKLTGVGGVFCAAHRSPEGVLHGHSYEVTVWFRHGHDARALQRHLGTVIADLDHTELPEHLIWGEQLAEHFARHLPGAVYVDVSRPLERIYARWTRDSDGSGEAGETACGLDAPHDSAGRLRHRPTSSGTVSHPKEIER